MIEDGCGLLILVGIGFVVFSVISYAVTTRAWREKTDREFEDSRRRREEGQALGELAAFALRLRRRLPYIPPFEVREISHQAAVESLARFFAETAPLGELAGTGLPVPTLPEEERRRHLYVTGKTGSGKTTFLEALIAEDLVRGSGLGVASPERDLFRSRLLPLVPEERLRELVYFAPGDPGSPLSWNPFVLEEGQDRFRAAEDLFEIVSRVVVGDALGPRSAPVLQNTLAALVGRPGATFADVPRLLRDERFRTEVVSGCPDDYVRIFFRETYPRLPRGAELPIVTRLDAFLRPPAVRKALSRPRSDFSIREILEEGRVFFLDLSGLSPANRRLIGELVFAKLSLELLRREIGEAAERPFFLYADEFQTFAGEAPETWRDLLSRGRSYGLALTLSHQFPGQLPAAVSDEILGNANSLVAFSLGARDARVISRELLLSESLEDDGPRPLEPARLGNLPVGEAWAKLAGGEAFRLRTPPPLSIDERRTPAVIRRVWEAFAQEPEPAVPEPEPIPLPVEKPGEAPGPEVERPERPPAAHPGEGHRPRPRPPEAPPGRGGPEHIYLQELVSRWGRESGFSAETEATLPKGGRVDVALRRQDLSIACEIAVSSTPTEELEHLKAALAAGFDQAVTVSSSRSLLSRLGKLLAELPEEDRARVHLLSPEDLLDHLAAMAPAEETTVAGYRVAVRYAKVDDAARRRKAIAGVIAGSLKRMKEE